jgi:hypothetical protein
MQKTLRVLPKIHCALTCENKNSTEINLKFFCVFVFSWQNFFKPVRKDDFITNYGVYFYIGAKIAASLGLPILIGHWLDEYLHTAPWLLLAGCFVGIIGVGLVIFRLWKSVSRHS